MRKTKTQTSQSPMTSIKVPSDGVLVSELLKEIESEIIHVYDLTGEKILTQTVESPEMEIDLPQLGKGTFIMVRITTKILRQ